MNEENDFPPVPRPPGALEKAEPGAKRILSGMVADTLALVKKVQRPKPRIVVVEDESVIMQFMESFIRDWFKDVALLLFSNSSEAWQELSQADPDLLILQTPMEGQELLPLLAERKAKFPILVTSGYFGEKELRQRAGPNLNVSVLLKPFSPEQFYRELLVHVGPSDNPQRRISRRILSGKIADTPAPANNKLPDKRVFHVLTCCGDNDISKLLQSLIETLLESDYVIEVTDKWKGTEILESVKRQYFDIIIPVVNNVFTGATGECRILKVVEHFAHLKAQYGMPIIALSGFKPSFDLPELLKQGGVDAFFWMPFDNDKFLSAV